MSRNRAIAEAFGAKFDPPLQPVQVAKVNGVPYRDAWMVATFHAPSSAGVTAHAFGGQLHAFVEVLAEPDEAESVGKICAATLQKLKDERK